MSSFFQLRSLPLDFFCFIRDLALTVLPETAALILHYPSSIEASEQAIQDDTRKKEAVDQR